MQRLKKANWKIDYPNRVMEMSSDPFLLDSLQTIYIKRKGGSPFTTLTIEGETYDAIIDLGSSAKGINVPDDHPLAEKLQEVYEFEDNTRKIYSIGGLQEVTEKVSTLPYVLMSNVGFENVPVDIRNSSELRVGMNFFKDCILIIDNEAGVYRVKRTES